MRVPELCCWFLQTTLTTARTRKSHAQIRYPPRPLLSRDRSCYLCSMPRLRQTHIRKKTTHTNRTETSVKVVEGSHDDADRHKEGNSSSGTAEITRQTRGNETWESYDMEVCGVFPKRGNNELKSDCWRETSLLLSFFFVLVLHSPCG